MRVDLKYFSDYDLFELLREILRTLYLNGRHSEIVRHAGKIHIVGYFNVILYPIK